MTTLSERSGANGRHFRISAIGISAIVAVLIVLDIAGDYLDGAPLTHLITEVFILCAAVMSVMYFGWQHYQMAQSRISALKRDLAIATHEAQQWRESNYELISKFALQIQSQLERWSLTQQESAIGMLLLKGFNEAEIAHLRQTSERAVRQQLHNVYRKSGIAGRAELLTFFLGNL